jgi:ribose 1,5-bisphosphokinase PhnN
MKILELTNSSTPSLPEILALAEKEPILLRTASGREYLLGIVDDFQQELDQLNVNVEFQEVLRERLKERGTISIEEIRARLS